MTEPPRAPGTAAPTYPGAPDSLVGLWNQRRRALPLAEGEALPPLDADLKALIAARVPPGETLTRPASAHAIKRHELRVELAGFSELAALNALLIAHLRKNRFPRHAPRLYRRLWQEEADHLLAELPPRWLISSVITFSDHGWNEGQRRVGLAMSVFFGLLKLTEAERAFSGQPADRALPLRRQPRNGLPLDMPGFSLATGGLDVNLLAQLWEIARADPLAGRIALALLDRLNADPRGIFRRLAALRGDLAERRAARAATSPPEAAE